jgi:hypothetical protein
MAAAVVTEDDAGAFRRGRFGLAPADVAALLALVAIAALYAARLDAWLINDDEGSYLYAAWRIALGEVPYRDFLTPQLPAFLLPGGALMRFAGAEAVGARALAAALTLGAGVWTWAAARRLFTPAAACLAGAAVLLHPLVFAEGRTYRPDPFMLFFATLGVLLFSRAVVPRRDRADPPSRAWLVASGAAFGLATLSKLFGVLALGACAAWLAHDSLGRGRPLRAVVGDLVALLGAAAAVVAAGIGAFLAVTGGVYEAVLGHHLMQGAGLTPIATLRKGLAFYSEFLRYDSNGLLFFVALAAAATAALERRRSALVFAWQLPTALVFLLLTRQLFVRHLAYVVPAMSVLFAVAVAWLAAQGRRPDGRRWSALAWALVAALLVPWAIADWHRSWEWEAGTERVGDLIQLLSEPDEVVLADYSELNFYGRRPTTFAGASLSEGAARSGQITWDVEGSPHRLKEELAGATPPLVLVDTATEYSQLGALTDAAAFRAWLDEEYGAPAGRVVRHHQVYEVYAPASDPLPVRAAFEGGPTLLAADLVADRAVPGESVDVRTAWRSDAESPTDLVATAVLVDGAGRVWASSDRGLFASGSGASRVRPTGDWAVGELTADRTPLAIPPATPPGRYEVRFGLYDPTTLARLEAADGSGAPLGQLVPVGELEVVGDDRSSPSDIPELELLLDEGAGPDPVLVGRGALPEGAVDAGATFDLDLWWRAGASEEDLSTRVTMFEPKGYSMAADRAEPLGVPGAPSSSWPADRRLLVRQRVRVPVLAEAAGGPYRLAVTVVGPTGEPVEGASLVDLGAVEVVGRDLSGVTTDLPPFDRALGASLGGVAELAGIDVPAGEQEGPLASVEAGDRWPVDLVWRALSTPPTPYRVTVQLLDDAGRPVAQHDGEPVNGRRPFTGWLPGEVLVDRHVLETAADLPPGSYRLVAAVYDPDSLERLAASGPGADGDRVVLGDVVVGRGR